MAYELGALPPWQYTAKPRHWHVMWCKIHTRYSAAPGRHEVQFIFGAYRTKREADAVVKKRMVEAQGFGYGGSVACYSKMCVRKIGD